MDSFNDQMNGMLQGASTNAGGADINAMLGGLDLSKASVDGLIVPDKTPVELTITKINPVKTSTGKNMYKVEAICYYPEEFAGAKFYDNWVMSQESLWKFKSAAKAADLLSEDGQTFLSTSHADFIGKKVAATCLASEYQGRKSNKIAGGYSKPEYNDGAGEPVIPSGDYTAEDSGADFADMPNQ